MLMMVETVGMSMYKLSSGPINAAWALLKAPEGGLDEFQSAMQSHYDTLSDSDRLFADTVSHAIQGISPEKQQIMGQQVEELLKPHLHNLPQIMSSIHGQMPIHGDRGRLRKSIEFQLRKGWLGDAWDKSKGTLGAIAGAAVTAGAIGLMITNPWLIPAVLAVDAINRSQGSEGSIVGEGIKSIGKYIAQPVVNAFGGNMDIQTDWGSVGVPLGFNDEAYIGGHFGATSGFVDPVIGHKWSESEDVGLGTRLMHIGAAAASAVNPFSWGRNIGAATQVGTRTAARGAGGAGKLATQRGAAQRMGGKLPDMPGVKGGVKQTWRTNLADRGQLVKPDKMADDAWAAMSPAQQRGFSLSPGGGVKQPGTFASTKHGATREAQMVGGKYGRRIGGRALQTAGPTGLSGYAIGLLGAHTAQNLDTQPSTSGGGLGAGYGSQSGSGFAGANTAGPSGGYGSPYGQGDIHTGISHRTGLQEVWKPTGSAFEQQHEFSGFKGENMKIGDRMLKELTEMMYKAKCPCGKDPCVCKEYANKGDKKKPAHGMVIIIGSKAGPGPSTDGKRDKLDSEKDDKDE